MNNLLNIEERNELERCEVVIKQGLKTFVEVGQALMLIRDKRLYRAEFGTFEDYCQDKWQLDRRYANRLVMASKVVNSLGSIDPKPKIETHARPLTKLEPELQAEAWQKTVEQHGENITQKKVEEVVKEFVPINNELKQAKKEPMFAEMTEQEILARAKEIREKQKEEKIEAIKERRKVIEETLEKKQLEVGEKKYRIIYADPPWSYHNAMPEYVTTPDDYYTLMSTQEICEMPVAEITEDNAVLFMWTTSPHLEESFEVVKSWGFKYKTTFIWDKIKHNMGHYNSVRHEILLVCTKGACTPDVKKLFDSVVSIERTRHSEKPEQFREIIETIYTHGNKIELFARQAPSGWDVFGNQINESNE